MDEKMKYSIIGAVVGGTTLGICGFLAGKHLENKRCHSAFQQFLLGEQQAGRYFPQQPLPGSVAQPAAAAPQVIPQVIPVAQQAPAPQQVPAPQAPHVTP